MASEGSRMREHRREDEMSSTASMLFVAALCSVLCASFVMLTSCLRKPGCRVRPYNSTLLGKELLLDDGSHMFEILVVTDLDLESKHPTKKNTWQSYVKRGVLTIDKDYTTAKIVWNNQEESSLYSTLAAGGRSMELSDLAIFDGHLISIDDRTGIIYRIEDGDAHPWVFVSDGPGNTAKGFKGEWLAVKDGELWVGGLGKEWTTTEGVFVSHNPMWVKRVTPEGGVEHVNWVENYKRLRSAVGIEWPGYMIHESAQWSSIYEKWFFLPRRASTQKYTEAEDEGRGTNYLLIASEDFSDVRYRRIGKLNGARGFSAFQFVPGTKDRIIIALKSEEKDAKPVASYVTVFEHEIGHILLDEEPLVGEYKYEGLAFV